MNLLPAAAMADNEIVTGGGNGCKINNQASD